MMGGDLNQPVRVVSFAALRVGLHRVLYEQLAEEALVVDASANNEPLMDVNVISLKIMLEEVMHYAVGKEGGIGRSVRRCCHCFWETLLYRWDEQWS